MKRYKSMKTKEQLFSELHRLLEEQENIIDRLISAGEEQSECLRKNDNRRLQEIVRRQGNLSAALSALEEKRVQVQKALEKQLDLPGGSTLRDLVLYAGSEIRGRLEQAGSSLREKTRRLQEINQLNRDLTGRALQFTNFMLNIICAQAPNAGYTRNGSIKPGHENKSRINKFI